MTSNTTTAIVDALISAHNRLPPRYARLGIMSADSSIMINKFLYNVLSPHNIAHLYAVMAPAATGAQMRLTLGEKERAAILAKPDLRVVYDLFLLGCKVASVVCANCARRFEDDAQCRRTFDETVSSVISRGAQNIMRALQTNKHTQRCAAIMLYIYEKMVMTEQHLQRLGGQSSSVKPIKTKNSHPAPRRPPHPVPLSNLAECRRQLTWDATEMPAAEPPRIHIAELQAPRSPPPPEKKPSGVYTLSIDDARRFYPIPNPQPPPPNPSAERGGKDGSAVRAAALRCGGALRAAEAPPLWFTNACLMSITPPTHAEYIQDIVRRYFPTRATLEMSITDAGGGYGGNTLEFARHFSVVNYVEVNKDTVAIFEHNARALGADMTRIRIIIQDYTSVADMNEDVLYMDPPWVIPQDGEALDLKYSNQYVSDMVISAMNKRPHLKLAILKAPLWYDSELLKRAEYSTETFYINTEKRSLYKVVVVARTPVMAPSLPNTEKRFDPMRYKKMLR